MSDSHAKWYINWQFNVDLSGGGTELSFRKSGEMSFLLVETEVIKSIKGLIRNIGDPLISSRYHIIGTRGFGKSTVLNYIAYLLFEELPKQKILPVYCSILGFPTDEKSLEVIYFRSLLEGMFFVPEDFDTFEIDKSNCDSISKLIMAHNEYRKLVKDKQEVTLEFVFTAFQNLLKGLKKDFNKIVFLIDGLDKLEPNIVLKFLRNTQERLNTLINSFNCMFIDSADPTWRATLESREFSGVRGQIVNLRGWTLNEVESLIRRRLEYLGIYFFPFEQRAIEILIEDFQGNPREILQYATQLLNYGAKERIARIGPGIARKIIWTDEAKNKLFEKIITDKDIRYAFEKLKQYVSQKQIMNILISAYQQRNHLIFEKLNYEDRSSIGITLSDTQFSNSLNLLIDKGCLKRSKIIDHLELEEDVTKLFDYVEELNQSLAGLPVVLSELQSEPLPPLPPPDKEKTLLDYVKKVFEENPKSWFNYDDVERKILENPVKKRLLLECYGEDSIEKFRKILPAWIGNLRENKMLIIDENSNSFRHNPFLKDSLVDGNFGEDIRSKEIIDKVEKAQNALHTNDFDTMVTHCIDALHIGLKKIFDCYQRECKVQNIDEVLTFLRMMDLEINEPMPLKKLLSFTSERAIHSTDEAKITFQNTILYIRRLYKKIHELNKYNEKNKKLLEDIKRRIKGRYHVKEREYFKQNILPVLMENYGQLVDFMSKIKLEKGYSDSLPKDLQKLFENKIIMPVKVYRCPICNSEFIAPDLHELPSCTRCKTQMEKVKSAYQISKEAYESWNVWIEEYIKHVLESFAYFYIESGLLLGFPKKTGVSEGNEVDVVLLLDGKAIAIECSQLLKCNKEINEVVNLINKIESLDIFDAIILVYQKIENENIFSSTISRYEKDLFPIKVESPNRMVNKLKEILRRIKEK